MRFSLLPSESSSCFDEIDVELLLVFGWFCSKEGNLRAGSEPSQEYFNCFQDIWQPMLQGITESEYVYAPGDNVVVLNRVHIFPGKFHMFSEGKTMNMYLCSCSQHVSFSTKLFLSARREHFYSHSVDVIELFIGKAHQDFLEAVVFVPSKVFRFVV